MKKNDFLTDDCIIEDEVYAGIKDIIKCKYCFKILKEPMICRDCQNVYCKACIDKKPNICKCKNPDYVPSIDKKAVLSMLKYRCKNCKKEVKYNEVESHLNKGCKKNLTETKLIEQIYKKKKLKKLSYDEIGEITNKGQKINHLSSKKLFLFIFIFVNSNNFGKSPCW